MRSAQFYQFIFSIYPTHYCTDDNSAVSFIIPFAAVVVVVKAADYTDGFYILFITFAKRQKEVM